MAGGGADPGISRRRRSLLFSPIVLAAPPAAALMALLVSLALVELNPHLELTRFELVTLLAQLTLVYLLPTVAFALPLGWLLRGRVGRGPQLTLAGLMLLAPLLWFVWSSVGQGRERHRMVAQQRGGPVTFEESAEPPSPGDPDPPPVVLLVIDGLDPFLLRELVAKGRLPTFERLLAEGTSGPLATLEPTLSPLVWTSLATGRLPEDHGVYDFVRHRLPGVARPIDRFPAGSALGHHVVPWLEELPWSGWRALPYTSTARRSRALWEIVDDYWPVGVYRWLVTWPAEPVDGFVVAGGLWASPSRGFDPGGAGWHPKVETWQRRQAEGAEQPLDRGWTHPPELVEQLAPQPSPPRRRRLRPYLSPGTALDPRKQEQRFIAQSLRDPALADLVRLVSRFHPKLLAAAFYSVDSFGHHFARQHRDGGAYAPALGQRYHHTDQMLGRLLDKLDAGYGRPYHLLVVSDHGWDFTADHHFAAPPGLLIARGPWLDAGRRVADASILDIAPLVLQLLTLPMADDMPGAATSTQLLATSADRPPRRLPSWQGGPRNGQTEVPTLDPRQRRELESLGYLP